MKFFFCEKCGKRVTDADLAAEEAKDKKLRGVFCKHCATGILTLETMPITHEQARKLLGKSAAEVNNSTPAVRTRVQAAFAMSGKESRRRMISRPMDSEPDEGEERQAYWGTRRLILVACSALAGLLLFGVFLLLWPKDPQGPQARALETPQSVLPQPQAAQRNSSSAKVEESPTPSGSGAAESPSAPPPLADEPDGPTLQPDLDQGAFEPGMEHWGPNLALASSGAWASGGRRAEVILDGKADRNYAAAALDTSPPQSFEVTFPEPRHVNTVRFLLGIKTSSQFILEVIGEAKADSWKVAADHRTHRPDDRGWQVVSIPRQVVRGLRLTGVYSPQRSFMRLIEFQAFDRPDVP